jgi:hypothetical protein
LVKFELVGEFLPARFSALSRYGISRLARGSEPFDKESNLPRFQAPSVDELSFCPLTFQAQKRLTASFKSF